MADHHNALGDSLTTDDENCDFCDIGDHNFHDLHQQQRSLFKAARSAMLDGDFES